MRNELANPISDEDLLKLVTDKCEQLYGLHEQGRDYAILRSETEALVGKPVEKVDVDGAFASVCATTFAKRLLADRISIPMDLSRSEMLELIERICAANGTEFQMEYWIDCLIANTGDKRISDLIYWPNYYFGNAEVCPDLSAEEILDLALQSSVLHQQELKTGREDSPPNIG